LYCGFLIFVISIESHPFDSLSGQKEDAFVSQYAASLVELCTALAELLQEQGENGSGYARKRNKVWTVMER
jgi:hypothetical protein